MAGELVGWNKGVTLRRPIITELRSKATRQFWPVQEKAAKELILSLSKDPSDFFAHIRRAVTSTVVKIAYGHDIDSNQDPFVTLAEKAQANFSLAATPNAFVVDWFPPVKFIPDWMPMAGFKRKAYLWRRQLEDLLEMTIETVKRAIETGVVEPSYVSTLLMSRGLDGDAEDEIKWSALSLYTGGADTTVVPLTTLVLVLVLHPEIKARLQREMDLVTSGTRLPNFQDRDSLPFLRACLLEVMRFRPAIPSGVAHRVVTEDVYKGFRIPKGAPICLHHDLYNPELQTL